MATAAERLDALETEIGGLKAMLEKVMPYLEGAANGDPVKVEPVDGYDPRGELLKAFRQIEAIANHINVKLPA